MNMDLNPLYLKYVDALDHVSGRGTWLDPGAVRLALRLALDEAHAAGQERARATNHVTARDYAVEFSRLAEYLITQGHDSDAVFDAAPAQIVDRCIGHMTNLAATASRVDTGQQLAQWLAEHLEVAVDGGTPAAQAIAALAYYQDQFAQQKATAERHFGSLLEREIEIANLRQTVGLLQAQLQQPAVLAPVALASPNKHDAHGNGNGQATAPFASKAAVPEGLSPVAEEYWEGCMRGAHLFRSLPIAVRLEFVQAVLRQAPAGEAMKMSEYDAIKPAWMPVASSVVKTYSCSWLDLPTLTPERIKVAA